MKTRSCLFEKYSVQGLWTNYYYLISTSDAHFTEEIQQMTANGSVLRRSQVQNTCICTCSKLPYKCTHVYCVLNTCKKYMALRLSTGINYLQNDHSKATRFAKRFLGKSPTLTINYNQKFDQLSFSLIQTQELLLFQSHSFMQHGRNSDSVFLWCEAQLINLPVLYYTQRLVSPTLSNLQLLSFFHQFHKRVL